MIRSPSLSPVCFLACALTVTALTGCHATTDARWATRNDTVAHWEHALPTLPVEVRGALAHATTADIRRAFPHASTPVGDHDARLVVDAGSATLPHDDRYCSADAQAATTSPAGRPSLTLSVCDGTRLVGTARTPLDLDTATAEALPREVDRLENLVLIGIDRSPAQFAGTER